MRAALRDVASRPLACLRAPPCTRVPALNCSLGASCAQLASRVTERRAAPTSKRAAKLAASPFGASVSPTGRKKGSASATDLGIQGGLKMSRSAGALLQPPSWDPVKGKMDATPFMSAPLWRDDALDAAHGSKSLRRALSSTGTLVRPSIKAIEEHQVAMLKRQESRRASTGRRASMDMNSSSTSLFGSKKPLPSAAELLLLKNGEAEGFVGKIHDEELVQQQASSHAPSPHTHGRPATLTESQPHTRTASDTDTRTRANWRSASACARTCACAHVCAPAHAQARTSTRLRSPMCATRRRHAHRVRVLPHVAWCVVQLNVSTKSMREKIELATREVANPFNTELERTLQIQSKSVERRGNDLLHKANDVRAVNANLRHKISKLRLERRLHVEFKEACEGRVAELNKMIPALVDQCNVLLFEGEKVQTKVQQTHQDAMQQRVQQEEQLADSAEQVARTELEIQHHEQEHYENMQSERVADFQATKGVREVEKLNLAKLGYLQWKTQWWEREFERLKEATGLHLDFNGAELDTTPISDMMARYAEQDADCQSLERFLDSTTEQANQLELQLARLKEANKKAAAGPAAPVRTGSAPPRINVAAELSTMQAKLGEAEATLRASFAPAANILSALIGPADFALAVREAECLRMGVGTFGTDNIFDAQSTAPTAGAQPTASLDEPAPDADDDTAASGPDATEAAPEAAPAADDAAEADAAPPAAEAAPADAEAEGAEPEADADAAADADADGAPPADEEAAPEDADGEAAPPAADDGESAAAPAPAAAPMSAPACDDAPADGAPAPAACDAPAPAPAPAPARQKSRKSVLRAAVTETPSAMLAWSSEELRAPHNSHRVKLLSEALDRCEHELLAVHDVVRNFPRILDGLAHPHKSTKERLPHALKAWAGAPGDIEVKNVHVEFKRLAAEAEKRQREEAMREDAAAEESKTRRASSRPSPSLGRASSQQSAKSPPPLGSPPKEAPGASLASSASVPALGSPTPLA
jgi:hypothetical protein